MIQDKDLYSRWFKKSQWTVSDAGLLLYGFDPDKWDHTVPQNEYQNEVQSIIWSWDGASSLEGIQSLLHDVRCDLVCEVSEVRRGEMDKISPLRIAQWACDVENRFWFSNEFYQYVQNPKNGINYSDNTWIDRDYDRWSKADCWSLNEAADLLSGSWVGREYEKRSWHPNQLKDEIIFYLHRLSFTKFMRIEELDGIPFFPAVELAKWAIEKQFPVPPKLLEKMGLKANFSNNPDMQPEKQCEAWLKQFTKSPKAKSKAAYLAESKKLFPKLGKNAFNRAWAKATDGTTWGNSGRLKVKA